MRPNDWTDECGQGHDKPTHVLHMCSPIRLVLPLRTHVALVLNSWAAQFLVLVTDKPWRPRFLCRPVISCRSMTSPRNHI